MNTRPEISDDRGTLGWRPFGAAPPTPRRRDSTTGWRALPGETSRTFPLWLPFAVALALGALVALVALLGRGSPAISQDAGRVDQREATSAIIAGEAAPPVSAPETERFAAAAPRPAPPHLRRAGHRAAAATFAPERVSDLKANPFVIPDRPAPIPVAPYAPRRVSDLKANPYR